jgi:hypothetical protein
MFRLGNSLNCAQQDDSGSLGDSLCRRGKDDLGRDAFDIQSPAVGGAALGGGGEAGVDS